MSSELICPYPPYLESRGPETQNRRCWIYARDSISQSFHRSVGPLLHISAKRLFNLHYWSCRTHITDAVKYTTTVYNNKNNNNNNNDKTNNNNNNYNNRWKHLSLSLS